VNRAALITGVGPGLGAALARRFAREGFGVGLVARKPDFIEVLAGEISAAGSTALSLVADVSRPAEATAAVNRVRANLGAVGVLIHNASSSLGEGLLATTPEEFEQSCAWRRSAASCARERLRPTCSQRGRASCSSPARLRGARRRLAIVQQREVRRARSRAILARELWPRGVHVAHVVIDGLIAAPRTDKEPSTTNRLDPARIADAYWHLATQDRSAWTLSSISDHIPSSSTSRASLELNLL
jgi:NAD(P)-dependent dehydrogenase (short-subunit alcohol dehydrogenase family)